MNRKIQLIPDLSKKKHRICNSISILPNLNRISKTMSSTLSSTNSKTNITETRGQEIESLHNISSMLNAGLDRRQVAMIVEMLELGVHPESVVEGACIC